MKDFIEKLCNIERDRVTAAEICIDELLTIMDRHGRLPFYRELTKVSSDLSEALCEVDGPAKRRERLLRIRKGLTEAFPMTGEDLEAEAASAR